MIHVKLVQEHAMIVQVVQCVLLVMVALHVTLAKIVLDTAMLALGAMVALTTTIVIA